MGLLKWWQRRLSYGIDNEEPGTGLKWLIDLLSKIDCLAGLKNKREFKDALRAC